MEKIKRDGKWGFAKVVIPCIYDYVWDFRNDFAMVELNEKYGFVNQKGELVIPCVYDYANEFKEGFANVKLGGKYGFINMKGEFTEKN